jgi:polysaccharide export outer membrane protein
MKFNCIHAMQSTVASLLLLTWLSAGCSNADDPGLSDNPNAPAFTGLADPNKIKGDFARFHVGDTVTVTFSGLPEGSNPPQHEEPIKEDGTITLQDIGKVPAVGKTAGELQNAIHDLYVPQFYTHLTVTVTIGDRVYYVRGEVGHPDRLVYSGEMTVTKAIASAGDFTDFANRKKVVLVRSNGERIIVNCKKVLSGDAPDPEVLPGDQIIVPRSIF